MEKWLNPRPLDATGEIPMLNLWYIHRKSLAMLAYVVQGMIRILFISAHFQLDGQQKKHVSTRIFGILPRILLGKVSRVQIR